MPLLPLGQHRFVLSIRQGDDFLAGAEDEELQGPADMDIPMG